MGKSLRKIKEYICLSQHQARLSFALAKKEYREDEDYMLNYMPEGWLIDTLENQMALSSPNNLKEAMHLGTTLEARAVLCDKEHNLHVDLQMQQPECMRAHT